MMGKTIKGTLIALSAASFFACGGDDGPNTTESTQAQQVKCAGINSCKGHSDCSGTDNDCKGLNDCAGKGYLHVASKAECDEKGGTVI